MTVPDSWPVVNLELEDSEIDRTLGKALEEHGYAVLAGYGLQFVFLDDPALQIAFIRSLLSHLERYLTRYRFDLSASKLEVARVEGDWTSATKRIEQSWFVENRWDVNLFAIGVGRSGRVMIEAGTILEEWSGHQIRTVPSRPVVELQHTLFFRPSLETLLSLVPRMTVKMCVDRCMRERDVLSAGAV